jgi:alanyl-tRNA synthetase
VSAGGPPAIERREAEMRAAFDAARAAGTGVADRPEAVERLRTTVDDLEGEVADLRERVVDARVAELGTEIVERDGHTWLVGTVDGLDANSLGEAAKAKSGEAADVVALVGRDGRTFVAVAADGPDAGAVVDDVTDAFGGGGGGTPEFAQGGGIDAEPEAVVEHIR